MADGRTTTRSNDPTLPHPVIDTILLTAARICTFGKRRARTNASGFFLARGEWLFLVTSQHALYDAPGQHFPDRIGIELHTDPDGLAEVAGQAPGTSGMTRRIAFV